MTSANYSVSQDAINSYIGLKSKRLHHCVVLRCDKASNTILVDKVFDAKTDGKENKFDYDSYANHVKKTGEPRYCIMDYPTGKANKIVFISWNPDKGSTFNKMIYASNKEALQKKLDGIFKCHQATDESDLQQAKVTEFANSLGGSA